MPNHAKVRARAKDQDVARAAVARARAKDQAVARARAKDQAVARDRAKEKWASVAIAKDRAKRWRDERREKELMDKYNDHFHPAEDSDYENDDYDDPREMKERDAPAVRGLELKRMLAYIIAFVLLASVVASVCRSNYEQTFVPIVRSITYITRMWFAYCVAIAKGTFLWCKSTGKSLQAIIYCVYHGGEPIEKVLIASSNINAAVTFITTIQAWAQASFGPITFIVLAEIPVMNPAYAKIGTTLIPVERLDVITIVAEAQKQDVDAVWADRDLELEDALRELDIRFICAPSSDTADSDSAVDKLLNEIIPATIGSEFPTTTNNSMSSALKLDSFQVNVEIAGIHPFPMIICSDTTGNKFKVIADQYGNMIAFHDQCNINFHVVELQVTMGIRLNKIPQVRELFNADINGIDPIDFLEGGHLHVYVVTTEGGPIERSNNVCISPNACMHHHNENIHLIAKGQTRNIAIANLNDSKELFNDNYGHVKAWPYPSDLQLEQ